MATWLVDRRRQPARAELDARRRAARLASALYVLTSVLVGATVGLLPAGSHREVVLLLAIGAGAAGLLIPALPWTRWPAWALLSLPALSFVFFFAGGLFAPATTRLYTAITLVPFIWIGLTQRPGISLAFTPALALIILGLSLNPSAPSQSQNLFVIPLAVLVGETLAQATRAQRIAEATVEALLVGTSSLAAAADESEASASIASALARLVRPDGVVVLVADEPDDSTVVVRGARGAAAAPVGTRVRIGALPPPAAEAIQLGEVRGPAPVSPVRPPAPALVDSEARSILTVPFASRRGFEGCALAWWRRSAPRVNGPTVGAIELLAAESARAIQRIRVSARLAIEAETDELTNLANRRAYTRSLERLRPADAVVVVDLDHFKEVNDEHGHARGDRTLRALADHMRRVARQGDSVARLGGDELAMILAGAGLDGARVVLGRLRTAWDASDAVTTFSAGVAVHRAPESPGATLARADAALYRAKAAGRHRVEIDLATSERA